MWQLAKSVYFSSIRDRLQQLLGKEGVALADWAKLGVPEWLADRLEHLGFRFPTEVQKRAARVLLDRSDAIIQSETGSGKTLSFLVPLLSLLDYPPVLYPDDLKGPQYVVVVPTKELGVQMALLIFKLFGGNLNPGIPGSSANMFNYKGPRGIKVKGLLDKEEVLLAKNNGYLRSVHVVVGTPACLAEVCSEPNALPVMQAVKAVAVDEVDACFQDHSKAMELLLTAACSSRQKPVIAFNGATIQEGLAEQAVQMGWMEDPVTVRVGRVGQIPGGLSHRYMVVDAPRKLAVLCRQMRQDLRAEGEDLPAPRVMVFADSEADARQAAPPLRSVLWGDHKMSVLLPSGEEPITALHSFRDNKATLMLATPAAARGLDLPAVSYVYNLGMPEDATGYLHRAGRAGRIGSPVKGIVTTLVTQEELPALLKMAEELNFELKEVAEPSREVREGDVDSAKRDLEDLYNLF
ncbi:hypothetical protein WJX72_002558 [[Myrmecia] bisecta]|uniref:RNA helicase n=1 Tax=[Myrmecia] bisecta TaxID=41462 RepID=A0AAW1Q8E5_9CHLO